MPSLNPDMPPKTRNYEGVKIQLNLEEDMVEESAKKVSVQYTIEQLKGQLHSHIPFKNLTSL